MSCIVVFQRPDRIVFGADRSFIGVEHGRTIRKYARKIQPAGRWWFVSCGFEQCAGHEPVSTLVRRAIAPTRTIPDALEAVKTALPRVIEDGFRTLHRDGLTPMFEVWVGGYKPPGLQLAFFRASMARLDPFEAPTEYGYNTAGAGWVHRTSSLAGGPAVTLMAQDPLPAWLDAGTAEATKRLIDMQIAATPDLVGGTVDVLQIDKHGARWMVGGSAA